MTTDAVKTPPTPWIGENGYSVRGPRYEEPTDWYIGIWFTATSPIETEQKKKTFSFLIARLTFFKLCRPLHVARGTAVADPLRFSNRFSGSDNWRVCDAFPSMNIGRQYFRKVVTRVVELNQPRTLLWQKSFPALPNKARSLHALSGLYPSKLVDMRARLLETNDLCYAGCLLLLNPGYAHQPGNEFLSILIMRTSPG